MEPLILTLFLVVLVALFVLEKLPPEVSALTIVFTLVLLTQLNIGLHFLSPAEALGELASDAVITVAAMFVISAGLMRSGVVAYIGDRLISLSGGNPRKILTYSVLAAALFSSLINNTPVVVLFVPLMLKVCAQYGLSPSKFLIPISYASILGGTTTLIGTSTNIVIAGAVHEFSRLDPVLELRPMGMFDITPVGLVIAIGGIGFILVTALKIMPERKTVTTINLNLEQKSFMTELEIQEGSPCVGKTVGEAFISCYSGLSVAQLIRGEQVIYPPVDSVTLRTGDILLTQGTANEIMRVQRDQTAIIAPELGPEGVKLTEKNLTLAEIVVMPRSPYIGSTIEEVGFKRRYGVNVIAILRKGRHMHIQEQIYRIPLAVGDTLLVQGGEDSIDRLRGAENFLLLEGIHETVVDSTKAPISIGILLGVVTVAAFNILPIVTLAVIGAILTVITNVISIKDAYKNFDASVLLLLAATITLGTAMEVTGTALLYGRLLVQATSSLGPLAMLAGLFLLTSLLTHMISNNAAAILMAHVALAAAVTMGYAPMPFLMAVLFGASACYATPIGYQTNLFVYGPGGYKYTDYLRLGMPLILLVSLIIIFLIPMVWPFVPITLN